ncbi:MAG: response regulator [Nitrospira sp.]|nr:response regulator [Nitrospira sp.]
MNLITNVVNDLKMPTVSGLEVLRAIKGDLHLRPLPVVMLPSLREELDLADGCALGSNAYVVKPVESHKVLSAVKELGTLCGIINEPPPENCRSIT